MAFCKRAVVKSCANCRLFIFRNFASLTGRLNFNFSNLIVRDSLKSLRRKDLGRYLSQSSDQKQTQLIVANSEQLRTTEAKNYVAEVQRNDTEVERNDTALLTHDSQTPNIPWYLRCEVPQRLCDQISDRERIPELPESPPPILHSLLNHLSVNLGLDYLTLLDLRNLEPSPSLGANLIMLIATARSEKHLHISADRLCRWLRTEYKLNPDADGLLGRNELKIKLKRKANKLKLMGSSFQATNDDGIRSAWVCVDVGVVNSGQTTEGTNSSGNFIGFGQSVKGVRIIVQLLTSEKREEVALEKLWHCVLRKGGQFDRFEDFDENGFLIEENE